jgi:flagellin-like hook-associated protein FlgL
VSDFTRYIHVLSNVRAVNGAETNSFSFAKNMLSNNLQNLQMANGRIVDTDVASEMTELAKNKIKMSTAVDMLAKHNKLSTLVDLTVMNLI